MVAPRQQLTTILILSAIDVLLCGFTAALTLFFIGAGANASSAARATEVAVAQARSSSQGGGVPSTIIIANYSSDSVRMRPAVSFGFETIPSVDAQTNDSVAWLLEESPTDKKPFTIVPKVVRIREFDIESKPPRIVYEGDGLSSNILHVTISVSGATLSVSYTVDCSVTAALKLNISEHTILYEGATCSVSQQP